MTIWSVPSDPWFFLDGRVNAPTGIAQYPHLCDLSSSTNTNGVAFNVRPPWQVAGVDYRVGINTGVTLLPVTGGGLPAGFTLDSVNKRVTFGASSGTLDGWDFTDTANGGVNYNLHNLGGTAAVIIQNCKFKQRAVNASGAMPIAPNSVSMSNLTVQYCEFDGNGSNMTFSDDLYMMHISNNGGLVQYCYFKNGASDCINIVGKSGDISSIIVRYNFCENLGLLAPTFGADPAHADFLQSYVLTGGSGTSINGLVCNFNTMYQPAASANSASCNVGVSLDSMMLLQTGSAGAGGAGSINSPECGYNTCVGIGATHYYFQAAAGHNTGGAWLEWVSLNGTSGNPINSPYIHDNYIYADATLSGSAGTGFTNGIAFYPSSGQFIVGQLYSKNVNMYNGSSYTTNP